MKPQHPHCRLATLPCHNPAWCAHACVMLAYARACARAGAHARVRASAGELPTAAQRPPDPLRTGSTAGGMSTAAYLLLTSTHNQSFPSIVCRVMDGSAQYASHFF